MNFSSKSAYMFTLCVDKMKKTQKIEEAVKKLNVWTCATVYNMVYRFKQI